MMEITNLNSSCPSHKHQKYANDLHNIQKYVKILKSQQTQLIKEHEQFLSQKTNHIIQFMSELFAYQKQQYARSITLLDNLLVIRKQMINDINLNSQFIKNLGKHFTKICTQFVQQNEYESVLYSFLYLILLFIYRLRQSSNFKENLLSLFTQKFVSLFSQIDVQGFDNKTIRVVSIVLAFIVKNRRMHKAKKQFTNMVLNLSLKCNQQISKAYLINSLKYLCHNIKLSQVYKFHLAQFLLSQMQNTQGEATKNCLYVVFQLIIKYRILTRKFIDLKIMKHFDANISKYPEICLNIFRIILPDIQIIKVQSWFWIYLRHILQNSSQISYIHVMIIQNLLKYISASKCVMILENQTISKLHEIAKIKNQRQLMIAVQKFDQSFDLKLKDANYQLYNLYSKIKQNQMDIMK